MARRRFSRRRRGRGRRRGAKLNVFRRRGGTRM